MAYSTSENPQNPFASVAGTTWEGGPPVKKSKYAIPRIGQGGGPLNLEVNSNPGVAAMRGNMTTLDGGNRFVGYQNGPVGYQPPMGMGSGGGGGGGSGGGGGGFKFGNQEEHAAKRFGNAPGTFALPSMISPASGVNPFQYAGEAAQRLYPGLYGPSAFDQAVARSNVDPSWGLQPQPIGKKNDLEGNPLSDVDSNPNPGVQFAAEGAKVTNKVQPYIVGEKGPELFIPHENGRIVPNKDVKKYMFKAAKGMYTGGQTQGSGYMTYRMPLQQGGQSPYMQSPYNYQQPQMGGWGFNPQGQGNGMSYYPPQMQYPQGFNPYAAQYLPQFMGQQQQQMTPEMQGIASNPDAPENPYAKARYIRMGLQSNARRRLADEEGRARVAQMKAQWAASGTTDKNGQPIYNPGSTPADISPAFRGQGGLSTQNLTSRYGTGSVALGPPGSVPHGQFSAMDISGAPAQFPMTAPSSDPNQTTWSQANILEQIARKKAKPSPLASLLGSPS